MELETVAQNMQKQITWLMSGKVSNGSGQVYGWINPETDGFIYDEIAAYFIKYLIYMNLRTGEDKYLDTMGKVLGYMASGRENTRGVTKGNNVYMFDTAVFLKSLLMYSKHYDSDEYADLEHSLLDIVKDMLGRNSVIDVMEEGEAVESKWSTSFSLHILKVAAILWRYAVQHDAQKEMKPLVDRICSSLLDDTGGIPVSDPELYTHCYCYASEAVISLHHDGYADFTEAISRCASYLAGIQEQDGGFYNYPSGVAATEAVKVSEATAQAARIWLFSDRNLFMPNIEKALSYLASMASAEGGIYYSSVNRDINTLATIFTVQASHWYTEGADPEWLL